MSKTAAMSGVKRSRRGKRLTGALPTWLLPMVSDEIARDGGINDPQSVLLRIERLLLDIRDALQPRKPRRRA